MRQIVLDTETTGLQPGEGHRIIEIGAVELLDRKLTGERFHSYLNPEREIDSEAIEIHGLTEEFLSDKPCFAEIVDSFLRFIGDAELIIHNAPFDVAFLDAELAKLSSVKKIKIEALCKITDSLAIARHKHPGQKNSLDALCRRYGVDNSARELHGALLDAEILADVFLLMTGGQTALFGSEQTDAGSVGVSEKRAVIADGVNLRVVKASADELAAHAAWLQRLDESSDDGSAIWNKMQPGHES